MKGKKILLTLFFLIAIFILFFGSSQAKKLTVICAGDSLMRPIPIYLRHLLPTKYVTIRDWTQGGLSSATYLSFFQSHPQWAKQKVDLVLLQLGTNDVSLMMKKEEDEFLFLSNLRMIIERFKKLRSNYFNQPKIIVATVPRFSGFDDEAEGNRLIEEVINPSIKALAAREKLRLLDQWAVLNGQPQLYCPDGVHPNHEGEKALARNWRRAIKSCLLSEKQRVDKSRLFDFRRWCK